MKIIVKIAKNELRYLFYSPVAWFVLLVFLTECAFFFTTPLYSTANWQDILRKNDPHFKGMEGLTFHIFFMGGVFQNVTQNLYLFIPILTMGLINREIGSGSAKLLYSSPVSLRQIVLGKYLGITIYNFLLVCILGIFMISGSIDIRHADTGMLLSAALGFYLLVCAYSAIGLFMSALSNYQIVSALGSFTVIFILSRIGDLWQRYDLVRDLTWFLSLQNRTLKMLRGLLVTRDLVYFIIVTALFVSFTWIKLQAGRENRPWYVRLGRYMTVLAGALLIGYVSSRPRLTGYLDATEAKFNTIPREMQDLIRQLGDSTLEVTLYTNLLGQGLEHGLPEARNSDYMATMWEPYLRFRPDIVFKYVYYYDNDAKGTDSSLYKSYPGKNLQQIATECAEMIDASLYAFRSPDQVRQNIDLQPESYRLVMQLKYRGRSTFLRTFDDPPFWPDLTNVSAAIKRLLAPPAIPRIYFVCGELERDIFKTGDREYALHTSARSSRGSLVNTGFDVDTLNLNTQDIPSGATALVLADPKMELSAAVRNKLSNYVREGGNLFITGEPGKQYVLNPVLQNLGVQLMNGQLLEPTWDETPEKVKTYVTIPGSRLYPALSWIENALLHGEDTLKVLSPGVTSIAYGNDSLFTVKPLLQTVPDRTWLRTGNVVMDSTLSPFDPSQGDIRQSSFATAAMLTRPIQQKEQRVVVSGDADFASNMRVPVNFNFVMPIYSWLTGNSFPVYMKMPELKDKFLRISAASANVQTIVFLWILPGLVLLTATILLIRRKRK